MMGNWHTHAAKFEIASFSRCRYNIGDPQILVDSQAQARPRALFALSLCAIYDGPWKTQAVYQIEVAAIA